MCNRRKLNWGPSRHLRWWTGSSLLALVACCGILACESTPVGNVSGNSSQSTLQQLVTGNAAKSLNPSGSFDLGAPAVGELPEIPQQQAEALAQIWARHFAPGIRHVLETDHGSPIDFGQLQQCGRSLYAASSFDENPEYPHALQRAIGPWWLVPFCQSGQMTLSVAVSALATDVSIVNGGLTFSDNQVGNDFFGVGVPTSWDGPVPLSPEHAAAQSGIATGRQISEVPVLIAPSPMRGDPQAAVWQIALSQPAAVHGVNAGTREVSQVVHGLLTFGFSSGPAANSKSVLAVPALVQPLEQQFRSPVGTIAARVRNGVAVLFDAATPAPGGH
jgi:hypothetical protein